MTPTNSHKRTEEQLIKAIDFAAKHGTTIILTSTDAAILCNIIGEDKMAVDKEAEDDIDKLRAEEW